MNVLAVFTRIPRVFLTSRSASVVKFCSLSKMPFYAVAKGNEPGIYTEWKECEKQVKGFKGPQFKKFNTREEAEEFIQQKCGGIVDKRKKTEPAESKKEDDNAEGKGKKRPHSDDEEDEEYNSAIKKRVYDRSVPDKEKFELDSDGSVVVYTDGCSQFNGKAGAKAGIGVYFGEDNPLNVSEPVEGRATNNTAEIQAITYALELIKRAGFSSAVINTDSQFVINCMTSWLSGWKKKGWKKSDGSEVINKADLIDLDNASNGLRVKYNHVKAHNGIQGNEMADKLAKAGSKRYVAPDSKE